MVSNRQSKADQMPRASMQPRDIPFRITAKLMSVDDKTFAEILPSLLARGFPAPDPDTGNFDRVALNKWCDARHPHLLMKFGSGTGLHFTYWLTLPGRQNVTGLYWPAKNHRIQRSNTPLNLLRIETGVSFGYFRAISNLLASDG